MPRTAGEWPQPAPIGTPSTVDAYSRMVSRIATSGVASSSAPSTQIVRCETGSITSWVRIVGANMPSASAHVAIHAPARRWQIAPIGCSEQDPHELQPGREKDHRDEPVVEGDRAGDAAPDGERPTPGTPPRGSVDQPQE